MWTAFSLDAFQQTIPVRQSRRRMLLSNQNDGKED
jgi:hypothetical protein